MFYLGAIADFFINPWMLGGLALVSAPIIIHLLNKRRFDIVDWAAIDFLFQADSRNRRRIRLEDLLLLALRILLIALIVLALARPVFQSYIGNREDERTIVIDDSFSMEASGGTGIPFVAARAAAQSQVEEAIGRGMAFNVWLGSQARQLIDVGAPQAQESAGARAPASSQPEFAARGAEVLRSLRELEIGDAPLGVGALLERLRERFASIDRPLMRSIVLLSDFRASDWTLEGTSELRPEIAAGIAALEKEGLLERLQWRFVDLGSAGSENLAIAGLRVATEVPTVRAPVKVVVEVKNYGEQERRGVRGWIEVGHPAAEMPPPGSARDAATVSPLRARVKFPEIVAIAAGETASVTVECSVDSPGEYPLSAVLEGSADRLHRDDRTGAVLQVRRGVRVLLVDGDPGRERFDGEAGFLAAALSPRGPLPSDVIVEEVPGEITDAAARRADVILVLNRANFSSEEIGILRGFVRRGGGLGYFLGNRVRPQHYAQIFPAADAAGAPAPRPGALRLDAASLFPVTLEGVGEAARRRVHLRIADEQHRAFEVFRGVEGSSLEQVGFDRYFKLSLRQGARVVARFDDEAGTAAIIEAPRAAAAGSDAAAAERAAISRKSVVGKVVVFNLTADRDWSDWPTDPSYPIVFQEWVRYLAPQVSDDRRVLAGSVMAWEATPGVVYEVVLPDGRVHLVDPQDEQATNARERPPSSSEDGAAALRRQTGAGALAFFRETYRAGLYRVVPSLKIQGARVPAGALEPFLFACVRDPGESRLEPFDEPAVAGALESLGVNLVVGRSERGRVVTKEEGGEIWRWLAMGAGLFLVVELFTAWWLGRR